MGDDFGTALAPAGDLDWDGVFLFTAFNAGASAAWWFGFSIPSDLL